MFNPFFFQGATGDLFAVYYPPKGTKKGDILHVHPFASDLIIARQIVFYQARVFASQGWGVLVPDLFGCGDSAGEFEDATLDIWLKDLASAVRWLRKNHKQGQDQVALWGYRFGGLLAMEFARRSTRVLDKMLLVEPAISGESVISELLTADAPVTPAAAERIIRGEPDSGAPRESRRPASGAGYSFYGYNLSSELVSAIDGLQLAPLGKLVKEMHPWIKVEWWEIGTKTGRHPRPATQAVLDTWQRDGCSAGFHVTEIARLRDTSLL